MTRALLGVCLLAAAALIGFGLYRTMRPPEVLLDVPALLSSAVPSPGDSPQYDDSGMIAVRRPMAGMADLTLSAPLPGHGPQIIFGTFDQPIRGRSRAMWLLGTRDQYAVVKTEPGAVVHRGGPFAEFRLFRTSPDSDTFVGFWAATPAALAAMQ
jgi:hypothetical protein